MVSCCQERVPAWTNATQLTGKANPEHFSASSEPPSGPASKDGSGSVRAAAYGRRRRRRRRERRRLACTGVRPTAPPPLQPRCAPSLDSNLFYRRLPLVPKLMALAVVLWLTLVLVWMRTYGRLLIDGGGSISRSLISVSFLFSQHSCGFPVGRHSSAPVGVLWMKLACTLITFLRSLHV